MTEPGEPSQPWTLAAICDWAGKKFRPNLEELEEYDLPEFEDLADEAMCLRRGALTTMSWNVGLIRKIALVGVYDEVTTTEAGKKVFAYVYGDNQNQVGYVVQEDRHRYIKLAVESDLCDVIFKQPFADVVDISGSPCTNHGRLRGLLCYLFLQAGVIDEIKWYSSFPREIKAACAWIGNDGEKPLPARQLPTPVLQDHVRLQSYAEDDQQERITRSQRSKKGREETSSGKESEQPQKRRKTGNDFHYHLEQIEQTHFKIKDDIKRKRKEITKLQEECKELTKSVAQAKEALVAEQARANSAKDNENLERLREELETEKIRHKEELDRHKVELEAEKNRPDGVQDVKQLNEQLAKVKQELEATKQRAEKAEMNEFKQWKRAEAEKEARLAAEKKNPETKTEKPDHV